MKNQRRIFSLKKILPLNSKHSFASYSFHAYISSILLDDLMYEPNSGSFSNFKILSSNNNFQIFHSSIDHISNQLCNNIEIPVNIQTLNEIPCHVGDVTGVKDSFNYIYSSIKGDGIAEVKIEYIKNSSVWAKSGLMIRESLDVDSKYVFIFATPSVNGLVIQFREGIGEENSIDFINIETPPISLKLERQGNKIIL